MTRNMDLPLRAVDIIVNWARQRSLWPMFFGLSCCFVEEAAAFTSRYDIARFGAEVLRGSPRQADLLIVSGTVFKKIAPVVLRLYEQMAEPKWVISMGSCSNSGGMYDVYSVVQGVDQILPVDLYIPGCPPRPEAVLQALVKLQEKIAQERPARRILGLEGGSQGTERGPLVDGTTKTRDPRGTGLETTPVRGTSATPPRFRENRYHMIWTPRAPCLQMEGGPPHYLKKLEELLNGAAHLEVPTVDMPCVWVQGERILDALNFLKRESIPKFLRLEDLTVVDESARRSRRPDHRFTVVYHLLAFDPPARMRVKVALAGDPPKVPSVTSIWPSANWYEREAFDMFGVIFEGHPNLRRLLMPPWWKGHPLRKDEPGRATEMPPYTEEDAKRAQPLDASEIIPRKTDSQETLILNLGPHHLGTHGLMRFVLELHGEEIVDVGMDIGYHHRGVEKIGERQTWHQFIPYTDRVDYLSGAANNLSYLCAVEKLAGVEVPPRAQFIRVMLTEMFRISNHLVWFATFAHDVGAMTPNFYTFRERERLLDIVEFITGARLHPSWFRIGGVAQDLPDGWKEAVMGFVRDFPSKLVEYEAMITSNPIFKARTKGIGCLDAQKALEWGVSGPNLRACGVEWDLRKAFPYSGYEEFQFDVPTARDGDCYSRYLVRVEEMRQSIRIIEQAAQRMPDGPWLPEEYRYIVPPKEESLRHIETLIHHFINVTQGPRIPEGEVYFATECPRGEQGYYLVSEGLGYPYRLRIRAPGFANVQVIPDLARGATISDLLAIIGSIDYILPDIDR